jgi:hypothetical protein
LQTFGILLREDGLLVELVVQRVGEEVATGHKVRSARDRPVAYDCVLSRASWS